MLLVYSAGLLILPVAIVVIIQYIRCRHAFMKYKKLSNGLPIFEEYSHWYGNHITLYLSRRVCKVLAKIHKRHGKTFGHLMGTKMCVSTIDLDLLKTIILDEPYKHLDKTELNLPASELENSIMLAPYAKWVKLRRYFGAALKPAKFKTPTVIHEIESSIKSLIDQIERLLDREKLSVGDKDLVDRRGISVEVDELTHKYSLNLVFSCFYKQYDLIDFDDDHCMWIKRVDEGLEAFQHNPAVRISMMFPIFRPVIDWLIWHFHPQGKWRQDLLYFVKKQARAAFEARKQVQAMRQATKGDNQAEIDYDNVLLKDGTKYRRNMIDTVIDPFLDGKLTPDEFFDTSCFLISAADRTASDSITHTIYRLATNPDVQDRLRKVVRTEGIDAEYLSWVINESLRIMPPAPVGCPRTITRDFELDSGYVLPAGTYVMTNTWIIHRLKEYWGEDADEFKPDRWRDTSHHHPMQFIPFGAGPRACPGKEFALFEMRKLFVALLTRYQFECKPKEDIDDFSAPLLVFVMPETPTYVTVRRVAEVS